MASISSPLFIRGHYWLTPQKQEALPGELSRFSRELSTAGPYHGHEQIATLCSRFITHLFACPDAETTLLPSTWPPIPRLDHFIAYALHRTRLHSSVTFAAMHLLRLLHARFPQAKGWASHRLFIASLMVAAKVICDDTYSNRSWCIIAQGIFSLFEINRMERKLCSCLDWQLNIDSSALHSVEAEIRRDFGRPQLHFTFSTPAPFFNYHVDIPTSKSSFGGGLYTRPLESSQFFIRSSPVPYTQVKSELRAPSFTCSLGAWPASVISTTTARNAQQDSSNYPMQTLITSPYNNSVAGRPFPASFVQLIEDKVPTAISCSSAVACYSKRSKVGYQQFAFPVVAVW